MGQSGRIQRLGRQNHRAGIQHNGDAHPQISAGTGQPFGHIGGKGHRFGFLLCFKAYSFCGEIETFGGLFTRPCDFVFR
jgi:hypothetical protein